MSGDGDVPRAGTCGCYLAALFVALLTLLVVVGLGSMEDGEMDWGLPWGGSVDPGVEMCGGFYEHVIRADVRADVRADADLGVAHSAG